MIPFWTFFLKKRQFTVLVVVALIAMGLYALNMIPKESAPEVRIPVGIVSAVFPGASAEDVEKLVTNKIEDRIANIENLNKLTSTSREGVAVITAEFNASADLDKSIQDLKDAVDTVAADLPREVEDPTVSEINFADQPVLTISVKGSYSPDTLARLGDELQSELQAVQGVSRVEVSGVRDREVQIVVKKAKLDQYGASLADVVAAIQGSNASLPVGGITVDGVQYALQFEGDLVTPNDLQDVAIPLQNGQTVYVRDLAEIVDGLQDTFSIARASEAGSPAEPSLTLNVFKSSGGNVVATADAVKQRLEELRESTLADGDYVVSLDLGEQVNKDLTELTRVGLETIALVMLSLLLTIGWRESIVAAVSIPLSFLIAFIGLWLSGNTINFVSLFALILAIGILIDAGIVVTEAIHTRMRHFPNKEDAALASLKEYAWPLIAGTLATVAVFAPLFFISGIVGEFIASIPFTLIFVLIASIFVALGIVPLVAIMFTKQENNRLEQRQEEYTHTVQEWYRAKLGELLDSRRLQNLFLWGIGIAFFVSLALPISGLLKTTFFPQEDIDFIFVEIEKPEGTVLAETDLVTRQVEEVLYDVPNIESFVTTVGSGSAFNASGGGTGSKLANITILLPDPKDREETSTEIVADLRERLSGINGAIIRVSEPNNGPPTGAPVLITFSADDLAGLEEATTRAQRVLAEIEGTTEITSSMKDNGLQVRLAIDRAKAAAAGLTPLQIAQTLRTAVNGTTATTIRGDTDIDVVVKLDLNAAYAEPSETTHVDPDALGTLTIPTPRGPVLLGSVVETELQKGNAAISHEDRKRIATVSAQVGEGTTAIEATRAFQERMDAEPLPSGVTMKIGGETEDVNQSFAEMGFAFIAGLVLMISIMVMQFNSLRHALYLILMVILSMIGVFGGLFITAQTLSFSSVIGIIALAGVIINHAIILTDSIHRLSQRGDMTPREAVIEASVSRLRPIVLTTITTVVGMIPLAGASSLWGPLAFAIMFGLSFSMILTLALVPVMTYRWPGSWFPKQQ